MTLGYIEDAVFHLARANYYWLRAEVINVAILFEF